jgi:hypothetical protein
MRQLVFGMLTAALGFCYSVTAEPVTLSATVILTFDFQGKVRFCYDQVPEIIYFQHDGKTELTDIVARSIDGRVRTIAQFPGFGVERSLSCSVDGSTIAALGGDEDHLYIVRASQVSVYKFDSSLMYSVAGQYSLLSPDGSMISVPGEPIHVSGPDVLRQMKFLRTERYVFFENGAAYVDEDRSIDLYQYSDDGWKKQRSIAKPAGFAVHEISRCGSHILASISDDNDFRFLTLDEQTTGGVDWLNRIGVRGLLGAFNDLKAIDGGYGRCIFPLSPKRDVRHPLLGIATFDNESTQRFSIEGPLLALSDDEIRLSKDGCYALFLTFKQIPEIPQFTMRQQAVVLKLAAPGCKS